jgi:phosphoribosylamine--glycine ligase
VGAHHRILVVGGGGREHAIAWRLGLDPDVDGVWVAPGNDGIAQTFPCRPIAESDPVALLALCRTERITLAVIGPEAPLAAGLADRLAADGIPAFGPSAAAAQLEASKWAAKQLMAATGVPTARAVACVSRGEALEALGRFPQPWVLKADGLAAGKGVLVTGQRDEAEAFLMGCFDEARFGEAGRRVVIEEFLVGEEASLMAVCDGERFVTLPAARDFKRARDGDQGPNTGGMGAYAPAARVDPGLEAEVARTIVRPVLEAMAARGTPYRGVLYAGLMLTDAGPRVVEFNCRFGDPETQVVLPLVEGALARLLDGAARGRLDPSAITRGEGAAVCVALVDEGYPERVRGTGVIEGLDELESLEGVRVFHAGTALEAGRWRVRGGRAAHVVACDRTVAAARARAYAAVDRLSGSGWRCRRDIAAASDGAAVASGAEEGTWRS